jgi:Fe-S-cluster containining protein
MSRYEEPSQVFLNVLWKIYKRTIEEPYFNEAHVSELERRRKDEGFKCRRCGKCCIKFGGVDLYLHDIVRWVNAGRLDLCAEEILIELDAFGSIDDEDEDDESEPICPFLMTVRGKDGYLCEIHEVKPICCKGFPKSREQAREFGCPGFD